MVVPKGHAKVPMGNNPATRVGMGKMPKSMGKGMHPTGIVGKKGSSIPASTGSKLHKKRG
jgi:hypothetical protein